MRDSYHVSLKVIMRNEAGEVLGLKAVNVGDMLGFYDLPGGRIDQSEFATPLEDILRREIAEEAGDISYTLSMKPVAYGRHKISSKPGREEQRIFYVFFEAQYTGGTITISDEHAASAWIDISRVRLADFFTSGILEGMEFYVKNRP